MCGCCVQWLEVDVVDGDVVQVVLGIVFVVLVVDKIQVCIVYVLDGWDYQFVWVDWFGFGWLCVQFNGMIVGVLCIVDVDVDGVDVYVIFFGLVVCEGIGFGVDEEVYVVLLIQCDVFVYMLCDGFEVQ